LYLLTLAQPMVKWCR